MNYINEKGRIFDIQRFSVHDGPGIRTIVFLKGCMLRCRWCCNPESQEFTIQSMVTDGKTKTVGRDVTAGEVIEEVKKDRIYYRRSGGGMTLSGGECFFQPDFMYALLRSAKEEGINTAIESTSCTKFETIERALPYIDYYLMDIKHTDSRKHKEYTGVSNELILENARRIAESGQNLTIRVPVIPGFNDTESEISSIAEFAAGLKGVTELHLLPYHRLGLDKYKGLGRDYAMNGAELLTAEKKEALKNAAEKYGLNITIGG